MRSRRAREAEALRSSRALPRIVQRSGSSCLGTSIKSIWPRQGMAPNSSLAAAFEDEIVILKVDDGSLLRLDSWASRIWRSCEGSTIEAIASSAHGAAERVRETLQVLSDAGLVRQVDAAWVRTPVEWV